MPCEEDANLGSSRCKSLVKVADAGVVVSDERSSSEMESADSAVEEWAS